jgi:hypothetical protein
MRERQSRHQLLALELGSLQCPGADAGVEFDEKGGSGGDPSRTEPAEQSCSDSASILTLKTSREGRTDGG